MSYLESLRGIINEINIGNDTGDNNPPTDSDDTSDEGNENFMDDDNEDTIRNRIRLYKRMTKQVEEYYKERTYVFNPRKGLKDYYKLKNYVSNNLV